MPESVSDCGMPNVKPLKIDGKFCFQGLPWMSEVRACVLLSLCGRHVSVWCNGNQDAAASHIQLAG